jgi:hypothetical protein
MGTEARAERVDLFERRAILAADLTHSERTVLQFVEAAAEAGRELESNEDIAEHLNFSGTGTVRGIMLRLERKGYIVTESFQRGRRVFSKRIGKWTRSPLCTIPHWRTVLQKSKGETPALPFHKLAEVQNIMHEVRTIMVERGLDMMDAQLVLMSYGVSMMAAERCRKQGVCEP